MDTWYKKTYVCSVCDALIEISTKSNELRDKSCLECNGEIILLSVEDATINKPTNEREQMLDNLEATMSDSPLSPAVEYNPNQLVTYKIIHGYSDPEYATAKVSSLEWDLHNARQASKHNGVLQSKIDNVKDIITESFADSEDQDTLRAIAEALSIELTRTIEWSATIEVSGTMEIDILEDVDIEQEIYDNLYVDSQNGNIEIGDTEVCNAREC